MTAAPLSFTSIMAKDVIALAAFYQRLFDLDTVPSLVAGGYRRQQSLLSVCMRRPQRSPTSDAVLRVPLAGLEPATIGLEVRCSIR